ncbi:hypothetical protein SAMN04244572_04752 [Azotobacter beijerinckii]|uniref:DUF3566 domain-containing protein n=1 Tax=Azotobacter beijerinckii TaxID=170623 RepID=A0A1H7AF56_9GAMM|nr:hypothetical protein [Azotobacter beijerinckii]SEJ64261.1 hypothetical protein SAMN04244572_04752 [Azotobacter beijerinckii]SER36330.1 hypothetical protein SAMN04244573_03462 [Azotobacter beijerinckii]
MKHQITRLSPHQNGKVCGILTAATSFFVFVPFLLFLSLFVPPQGRPPFITILLVPLFYLVMGYLAVRIGCTLYNFAVKYIGGLEFDAKDEGQ